MNRPIFIFFLLLILVALTSYNPSSFKTGSDIFKIKKIEFENLNIIKKEDLSKLFYSEFNDANLLILNEEKILRIFKKNSFIDTIEVKKVYPKELKIKIYEKNPIAIVNHNKRSFYLTDKGELIKYFYSEILTELPYIFGNQKNFLEIYSALKKIDFPINEIKAFYYFNVGRWDIILKDKRTIKLPVKDFNLSLENYMKLKQTINYKKYSVFDYRIKNQLILN